MPDFTLEAFVKHIGERLLTLPGAQREALKSGAEKLQEHVTDMFGTYNNQGKWPQLAESTQADRFRQGFPPNEPLVRTGDLRDSIESRVLSDKLAEVGTDDETALYHEYGTAKVPARPFFGPAVAHNGKKIAEGIGRKTAKHVFNVIQAGSGDDEDDDD